MNKITFSHKYPKFGNATSAKLEKADPQLLRNLPEDFLEYDTRYLDKNGNIQHYDLLKLKEVIVLHFVSNKGEKFTTIRRLTGEKLRYYQSKIGQVFQIVVND